MIAILKRLFNEFVFGNFFIAMCSVAMIWTTFLMNDFHARVTPFTIFLASSTYLLYNFHRITYRIDFTGLKNIFSSIEKIHFSSGIKIFYLISFIAMIVSVFYFDIRVFFILIPMVFLALAYSIPVIIRRNKKIRLPELPLIKTPVLALVWGVSTTIIPLAEQNISLNSSFIWLQLISRCLFIYALCIPFEMRDIETDKLKNIKTFPAVHGIKATKIFGSVILLLEMITHHLMTSLSYSVVFMLDLSSVIAFFWILLQNNKREPYFYKFLIDGTMLIRFLLLLLVIQKV